MIARVLFSCGGVEVGVEVELQFTVALVYTWSKKPITGMQIVILYRVIQKEGNTFRCL
jgi:hypothetical protein